MYLKIKPCDTVLSIIFNTFTDELTDTVFNSNQQKIYLALRLLEKKYNTDLPGHFYV